MFQNLVITQIVKPTNKLNTSQILTNLNTNTISYHTIQRHLNQIKPKNYQNLITKKYLSYTSNCNKLNLLLYNITTLHFKTKSKNNLHKINYTKKRQIDTQIVIKLLINQTKFPLKINYYKNNTTKTTTIIPIIQNFIKQHKLTNTPIVVTTNTNILSTTNLKTLNKLKLSFIINSQTTKTPQDLKSHFH